MRRTALTAALGIMLATGTIPGPDPAVPSAAGAPSPASTTTAGPPEAGVQRPACADPEPGHLACLAEFKPLAAAPRATAASGTARPQAGSPPKPPASSPDGPFFAADLHSLYGLPVFTGAPTIAIVDVGHDPGAVPDLSYYRAQTGIAPLSPGQLVEVDQHGATVPLPVESPGWDMEIALDLDVVSAMCASCRILLVDADSSALPDILTASGAAVALGAQYVSLSLGSVEFADETSLDRFLDAPDVTYVAASGDGGFGSPGAPALTWPASSPHVVAAGGVSATRSTTLLGQTTWSLSAWGGAGSGCSAHEPSLPAQSDAVPDAAASCPGRRGVADLAALADPDTGVAVYYHQQWVSGGGTSAAAPALAAMYAMAGNHTDERAPYASVRAGGGSSSGIRDVTSGASAGCPGTLRSCSAQPGWDGPTGLGVPQGLGSLTTTTSPHGPTTILLTRPGDLHVKPLDIITVPIGFATSAPYDAGVTITLPPGLTSASPTAGAQVVSGSLTTPGVYTVSATPRLAGPDVAYVAGPSVSFTITVATPSVRHARRHRLLRSGRGAARKARHRHPRQAERRSSRARSTHG